MHPPHTDTATPASRRRLAERIFGAHPFAPLVHAHSLISVADAFVGVSLAGSLFFNVSVDAARPRIILYLVVTMAPFAVLAPFIAPLIDRVKGGQRLVVALTCAGRAGVCLALAQNLQTLLFYPLVFTALVLGKAHFVAKNALVPRLINDSDSLVEANSRLARVATAAGALGGLTAATVLNLSTAVWVLRCGSLAYVAAALSSLRLPPPLPHRAAAPGVEYAQLHSSASIIAVSAMGILRGGTGFLVFLIGFALKRAGEPAWFFGLVFGGSAIGAFAGSFVAPRVRRRFSEEWMLAGALAVPAFLALVAAIGYGRTSLIALAFGEGVATSMGKRAFESLIQRDAPDADRGRMFARFETRFQLSWVVGALIPVVGRPPAPIGLAILGLALGFGAFTFLPATLAAYRRDATGPVDTEPSLSFELLRTAQRAAAEGRFRLAVVQAATAAEVALEHADPPSVPRDEHLLDRLHELRHRASVDEALSADDVAAAIGDATDIVSSIDGEP